MSQVIENVESVCPECFKGEEINKIPAQIVEEDGKIWIEKKCPEHGSFKSVVFADSKLYKKWEKYGEAGEGPENVKPLPFSETQLYDKHKSQSVLTNVFVTNRCNLRCSYCFANSGAEGFVYEPSLEELEEMMRQVREEKPVPSKAVQITGGEPTIRNDLLDIVEMAVDMGFRHVQVNTNGIKLAESGEYCQELRDAGVNTIYMSFDGLTKESNPWIEQNKKAIENLRKAGLGVVLVPTVIKDMNLDQLGDIINYAKENLDVVRGVNFQPVSFTGRITNITEEDRESGRVDYATMIKQIEKDLDGQIGEEDWYPVPFVYPISKLVETVKGERQVEFTPSPKCGGATYAFVDGDELVPVTDFVGVEGLIELIEKESEKSGPMKKIRTGISLMRKVSDYIDEEKSPEGVDIKGLIVDAIRGGDYNSLGDFHKKSLFLGSMWFQDAWNLNMDRLSRCVIHYATPEGIVPFCTYNGLNVGQKIREKHSIPVDEWEEKTGKEMRDDLWDGSPIS
ncbi:hypothetical protein AKJ37_04015 [candidate division MSBL1 archaeon SCGC-AAA259I09]|uniref:Radical SAM core domain-containing protein n=1 Tax=candidate division MSBL1 archaeon SCGC-AAA259I09 TaxID=1698267 RepID=A0A133US80_9EURY|nr:hypothetical protein AKJ37_04015 [candidate division MSBL1 archaeon SCGC-AAA259I09]